MSDPLSDIPPEVLANLEAVPYQPRQLAPLARCYRVLRDLGYEGTEPFSVAYAYSLITDGPSWLGEVLRRILGSKSTRHLLRHVEEGTRQDNSTIQFFSRGNLAAKHTAWSACYPRLREHPEIFPLLQALLRVPLKNDLLLLHASVQQALPPGEVESIESRLGNWLKSATNPLTQPADYVITITTAGQRFTADFTQGILEGEFFESEQGLLLPRRSLASLAWRQDTSSSLQGLLTEFEDLINSTEAVEADFQSFFEGNPEFLYLLGNYDEVRSQVSIRLDLGLSPVSSGSTIRPDFLLHNPLTDLWDVLDLKRATYQCPLIVGSGRNPSSAYGPSTVLAKALTQLRAYQRALQQSQASEYLHRKYGIRVSSPVFVLLMGKEENFPSPDRFTRTQLIREVAQAQGVDLVPYDRLFQIARHKRFR